MVGLAAATKQLLQILARKCDAVHTAVAPAIGCGRQLSPPLAGGCTPAWDQLPLPAPATPGRATP